MKKLAFALVSLGLSTAAFAGAVEYQEPEAPGFFMLGVEGLYVSMGQDDFLYGYEGGTFNSTGILNTQAPASLVKRLNVDPDFHWGWHADAAYSMPGNGFDVGVAWTHLENSDSDSSLSASGSSFAFIGPFTGSARGSVNFSYSDVDLIFGKALTFDNRYHLHPFAGVRYGRVKTKAKAFYANIRNAISTSVGNTMISNSYAGVGPRVGVDATIEIANGFSLTAKGGGSILVGDYHYSFTANRTNTALTPATGTFLLKNSDEMMTVPELDYRIGLNYAYEFSHEMSFSGEVGWQATQYLDVVDRSASTVASHRSELGDWSFQGPYVRFEVDFA